MVALDVALSEGMLFIFDRATNEQVEAPESPLLLLASILFSSSFGSVASSVFLLLIIPLLTCYGTYTYWHYLGKRQQRAKEVSGLQNTIAEREEKIDELEEEIDEFEEEIDELGKDIDELEDKIARDAQLTKDFSWMPAGQVLIESVSDHGSGRQFVEFGVPPPLNDDEEFWLPSPAVEAIEKHAAMKHYHHTHRVLRGPDPSEDEEEPGPVARGAELRVFLKDCIKKP